MTLPLPYVLPEALERRLREAYATPPRAYHNFDHVLEVLGHFASVQSASPSRSAARWDDPVSVSMAILFHDAIYVAGRSDNEAESANLAERCLADHPLPVACDIQRVRALILLTARHGALEGSQLDHDAALFVDCDMAILAAEPARFAAYERAIASEYAHVPEAAYRIGRARFLQKLLAAPRIYHSPFFFQRLERAARVNIAQALAAL